MKKAMKVAVAAGLMGMGASAVAETVSFSQTTSTITDITHLTGPANFGFNAFNTSLGTLDSVEITFYSSISGRFRVENTADAQTVTMGSGALLSVNVGTLAPIKVSALYSKEVALGAYDGDTDFAGTSGKVINFTGQSVVTSTGLLTSAAALHAFSTPSPTSTVSGIFEGNGPGNVTYAARSTVDTYAVLTYNYTKLATPVPEAETYAMLLAGLGLVGVVARRRRKAA